MLVHPSTKDHSFRNEQSNLNYNVPVSSATLNLSLVPPLCLSISLSVSLSSPSIHPSPGLGYHKDLQTRATFMEVLTKILQQGTEFDTLAETVLADRFERLVELVTMMGDQGELPIAMALANVVPCSQWVCSLFTTHCPFSGT